MKVIELDQVSKSFKQGGTATKALSSVNLSLELGESMAIMGKSGSGKSTLLNIIGGLDRPSAGSVKINQVEITKLGDSKISQFRNQTIGFVFQFFNLLDYLTATENVMVQSMLAGKSARAAKRRAQDLLKMVGMHHRYDYYPKQLSGGEMQRVAVARSLANHPKLLLADEPTANLDKASATNVLELFSEISASGVSVVVITHDSEVSSHFSKVLQISDGKIS
jgi:ABC-type lipoprotein export system ATPase subunit